MKIVAVCTMLILFVLGGIFTDWYGVLRDPRPAPAPIGTAKPTRPPHPASIYYPPGEPQPKVPGDPGWRNCLAELGWMRGSPHLQTGRH